MLLLETNLSGELWKLWVILDPRTFLPHHPVVREDKLKIVYYASAKTCGPSLNDCLYAGPKFGQSIMDILLSTGLH